MIALQSLLRRFPHALALAAGGLLSVASLALRVAHTGRVTFVFLCWNLLLAAIPYALALGLRAEWKRTGRVTALGVALVAMWLLFFPNAPYMLTDFVHLRGHNNPLWWFDLLLLSSYIATAWLFGLVSLGVVHGVAREALGAPVARAGVLAVCWLTGLGVWLGRFERFNSWDVVGSPRALVLRAGAAISHPISRPAAHVFALFFGALLALSYAAFRRAEPAGT
jgi:uncharacterized membrane protein